MHVKLVKSGVSLPISSRRRSLEGRSHVQLAESDSGPPSLGFRALYPRSHDDFANLGDGYDIPELSASG